MNSAGHPEATARRGLELTPFRGLRYDPDRVGSLAAVTSPPYDVVVRPDGLLHLESADPYNIVRLILPLRLVDLLLEAAVHPVEVRLFHVDLSVPYGVLPCGGLPYGLVLRVDR